MPDNEFKNGSFIRYLHATPHSGSLYPQNSWTILLLILMSALHHAQNRERMKRSQLLAQPYCATITLAGDDSYFVRLNM